MLSSTCDVNKPGVKRLDQVGNFAVIANKKLYDGGHSRRFAVVNTIERWVDSVHGNYREAVNYTHHLM